jgi:hypothetical protein
MRWIAGDRFLAEVELFYVKLYFYTLFDHCLDYKTTVFWKMDSASFFR